MEANGSVGARVGDLNGSQVLLQTAFSQFAQSAEIKLNSFIYENLEEDVDIASPLEAGYDHEFDRILRSLGSTAQRWPKLIVDCIMAWRKTKSDNSDSSVAAIVQAAATYDGSGVFPGSKLDVIASTQALMNKEHFVKAVESVWRSLNVGGSSLGLRSREIEALLKERKSLVANFVLCRALTEILENLRPDTLPKDLGLRLEDMIFAQLKSADPELLAKYPNRQANLDYFSQVIGQLSKIRFASVSDRFIKELSPASMPKESKIEMLLRCMRYIDLKIYPMDALEESADFLQILADFFKNSPLNSSAKFRYAELFVDLLEPIAAIAVAEVNMPIWKEAVESLYNIGSKMILKGRQLNAALAVNSVLLCVSRRDFFHQRFSQLLETLYKYLKDAKVRPLALACILRLQWVYLFRNPEHPSSVAQKRVEIILENVLPSLLRPKFTGGSYPSPFLFSNESNMEYCTYIVWHICCKYRDLGFAVIRGLLGVGEPDHEPVVIERAIAALKVLLLVIKDMELSFSRDSVTATQLDYKTDDNPSIPNFSQSSGAIGGVFVETKIEVMPPPFPSAVAASDVADLALAGQRDSTVRRRMHSSKLSKSTRAVSKLASTKNAATRVVSSDERGTLRRSFSADRAFEESPFSIAQDEYSPCSRFQQVSLPHDMEDLDVAEVEGVSYRSLNSPLSEVFEQRMGSNARELLEQVNLKLTVLVLKADLLVGTQLIRPLAPQKRVASAKNGRRSSLAEMSNPDFYLESSDGAISEEDSQPPSIGTVTSINSFSLTTPGQLLLRERLLVADLVRSWIEALPRVVPNGLGPNKILELLSKYTLHGDPGISNASVSALKRIANCLFENRTRAPWWLEGSKYSLVSQRVAHTFITTVFRIGNDKAFDWSTNHYVSDATPIISGLEPLAESIFTLYAQLVRLWFVQLKAAPSSNFQKSTSLLEMVEEVESKALLALVNHQSSVRRLGLNLLKLARSVQLFSVEQGAPLPRPSNREARKSIRKSMARIQQHQSLVISVLEERGADLVRQFRAVDSSKRNNDHPPFSKGELHNADGENAISLPDARDTLLKKIESSNSSEAAVWFRCLPETLRMCRRLVSPKVINSALNDLVTRVLYLYPFMYAAGGTRGTLSSRQYQMNPLEITMQVSKDSKMTSEQLIQQFGTFLAAVCSMMTFTSNPYQGSYPPPQASSLMNFETPFNLTSIPKDPQVLIQNPKQFFNLYFPFLYGERPFIRFATVSALGELPRKLKPMLFYELLHLLKFVGGNLRLDDENSISGRHRANSSASSAFGSSVSTLSGGSYLQNTTGLHSVSSNSSSTQSPSTVGQAKVISAIKQTERLRMELTHLLLLNIESFTEDTALDRGAWSSVAHYIEELANYLQSPAIQTAGEHQLLRCYFAQLVNAFYSLSAQRELSDLQQDGQFPINLDFRAKLFSIFLSWCGHGPLGEAFNIRALRAAQVVLDQVRDTQEHKQLMLVIEEQRRWLHVSSSKAIAALAFGPFLFKERVQRRNASKAIDIKALLVWVEAAMTSGDDELFPIAQRALQNALLANLTEEEPLFNDIVRLCVVGSSELKTTQCYFFSLVNLLEYLVTTEFDSLQQLESYIFQLLPAYSLYSTQSESVLAVLPNSARLTLLHFLYIARRIPLLLHLAIYKLGDSTTAVRKAADKLLRILEKDVLSLNAMPYLQVPSICLAPNIPQVTQVAKALGSQVDLSDEGSVYEPLALTSLALCVYGPARMHTVMRMASSYPQYSLLMFCEGIKWLDLLSQSFSSAMVIHRSLEALLNSLAPWLSHISLSLLVKERAVEPQAPNLAALVIHNLLHITTAFGDSFTETVGDLWVCVFEPISSNGGEVYILLDQVMELGCYLKNPLFVVSVKRVLVWLCRTSLCPALCNLLLKYINSKSFVPHANIAQPALMQLKFVTWNGLPLTVAPLSTYLSEMPQRPPLSHGQLSCMFLADLVLELGPDWVLAHLPLLLHSIIIQLDHFVTIICEHARLMLFRILSMLTPRLNLLVTTRQRWDEFLVWLETSQKDGKRLWNYEDLSLKKPTLQSCDQMAALIDDIVDALIPIKPELDQHWGQTALKWGTCCPVRHLACRSLQIVRILMPRVSAVMLSDLAHRLSNTLADSSEEVQGFAMEGLATMDVMLDSLKEEHALLPPLIWMCTACLYSPNSWECAEAIRMLLKIFSRLSAKPLFSPSSLVDNCPAKWNSSTYSGLQPLLLKGFTTSHPNMGHVTSELFRQTVCYVNRLPWDPIVYPKWLDVTPLFALRATLGQLWPLVKAIQDDFSLIGEPPISKHGLEVASGLLELATKLDSAKIVRLLQSYLRGKLLFREEFLKQLANVIQLTYFPQHTHETLTMLLQISQSLDRDWRRVALQLLKQLVPSIVPSSSQNLIFEGPALKSLVSLFRYDDSETEYELVSEVINLLIDTSSNELSGDKAASWLVLGGQSLHNIAISSYCADPVASLASSGSVERNGVNSLKSIASAYDSEQAALSRTNMDSVASHLYGKNFVGQRRRSSIASHPMPPYAASTIAAASSGAGNHHAPETTSEPTANGGELPGNEEPTVVRPFISQRRGSLPQESLQDEDVLDNYFSR